MSHEAILFGCIVGATGRPGTASYSALPAGQPQGTFRRQVIHFGASIKDDPHNRGLWAEWLDKFESLLRQLYWRSAVVHLATDFEPERVFEWQPTEAALAGLYADSPVPVGEWERILV